MKKRIHKVIILVAAAVMVFACGVFVNAVSFDVEGKRVIDIPAEGFAGYKIFDIDASEYSDRIALASIVLSRGIEANTEMNNFLYPYMHGGNLSDNNPGWLVDVEEYERYGVNNYVVYIRCRGTSNFNDVAVDLFSVHDGFSLVGSAIYGEIKKHLNEQGVNFTNSNTKFLVTGHSLGGAVANIVGQKLMTDYQMSPSNVFVYTFAAPNHHIVSGLSNNNNFHNIVNTEDLIPNVPWNYSKNGHSWYYSAGSLSGTQAFEDSLNQVYGNVPYKKNSILYNHSLSTYLACLLTQNPSNVGSGANKHFLKIEIKCPVDIKIYNDNGDLVGSTNGDTVDIEESSEVLIGTDGEGGKTILAPAKTNCKIDFEGTDTGTMEYVVQQVDAITNDVLKESKFSNVKLEDEKTFSSEITDEKVESTELFVTNSNGDKTKEVDSTGNEKDIESNIKWDENACAGYSVNNVNSQSYEWNNADTIKSYLVKKDNGYMRVQADENIDGVLIEYLNNDFSLRKRAIIKDVLPIFGGFYAYQGNYYLVSGQKNTSGNKDKEVYRITKYDSNWNEIDTCSIRGQYKESNSDVIWTCNTYIPFDGGCCRMEQLGDELVIRTANELLTGHQANTMFLIDTKTMTLDSYGAGGGYISHSFNQFVHIDNNKIVALDHGDAVPRSIVLCEYYDRDVAEGIPGNATLTDIIKFDGEKGDNYTGAELGGFEIVDDGYLICGNSTIYDSYSAGVKNVFVSFVNKESKNIQTTWLTTHKKNTDGNNSVSNPHLVKINNNKLVVLWTYNDKLQFVVIDSKGNKVSSIYTKEGQISDCVPVVSGDNLVWYVSSGTTTDYYSLSLTNLGSIKKNQIKTGHSFKTVTIKAAGNCITGKSCDECIKCGLRQNYKNIAGYSTSYVKSFKVSKGKKCFTAKWKKQSKKNQKKFTGYQIRYSTNSKMTSAKYTTAKKSSSSKKIKKLVKKKKYYVQVRTYKTVNGTNYYSTWSSKKAVKTK